MGGSGFPLSLTMFELMIDFSTPLIDLSVTIILDIWILYLNLIMFVQQTRTQRKQRYPTVPELIFLEKKKRILSLTYITHVLSLKVHNYGSFLPCVSTFNKDPPQRFCKYHVHRLRIIYCP